MKENHNKKLKVLGTLISELLMMEQEIQIHFENGGLVEERLIELKNLQKQIDKLLHSFLPEESNQKLHLPPIGFIKQSEALEEYRNAIIRIDHIVSSKTTLRKKTS